MTKRLGTLRDTFAVDSHGKPFSWELYNKVSPTVPSFFALPRRPGYSCRSGVPSAHAGESVWRPYGYTPGCYPGASLPMPAPRFHGSRQWHNPRRRFFSIGAGLQQLNPEDKGLRDTIDL